MSAGSSIQESTAPAKGWRRLGTPVVRRYLQAGTAIGIRAMASLVCNKLIAVTFGPAGVALLSHFTNLLSLIIAVPNDGVNRGLVRYGAVLPTGIPAYGRLIGAALAYVALTVVVTGAAFLFFSTEILGTFAGGGFTAGTFALWYWLLVPLYLVFLMLLALLLARQDQPMHLLCMSTGSVANVLVVGFGIFTHQTLQWCLLAWLGGQLLALVMALAVVQLRGYVRPGLIRWPERRSLRQLGSFVALASIVALFGRSSDFIVRQYALTTLGITETGLWQAVVKMGDAYITPVNNLISTVFFPSLSLLATQPVAARRYMQRTLMVVVPGLVVVLGTLTLFSGEILALLNSDTFVRAAPLYKWQALTDAARIVSYFLAASLLVRVRLRLLFWLEAGSAVAYLGLVWAGPLDTTWLLQANLLRYVLYLLALLWVNRSLWQAPVTPALPH